MNILYVEFEQLIFQLEDTFNIWDTLVKEFKSVSREVTRKRSKKFILIRLEPHHKALNEGLQFINIFKKDHQQKYSMIMKVVQKTSLNPKPAKQSSLSEINAEEEIKRAYVNMKYIDILDVINGNYYMFIFEDGLKAWITAENTCNEQIAIMGNKIIIKFKECLSAIKTILEMIDIFYKYNILLDRHNVNFDLNLDKYIQSTMSSATNR